MSNPSAIAIILLLDPILPDSTFSSCWMPLVLLFIPNNGVFPYKTMINPSLFSSCASIILPFSATKASTDSRFCLFNNGISCFIFYFLVLSQLPPIASGLRDLPKGSSPGTNVSRTAPSFIILVCVFFVLALVIVYSRQCVENHHRPEGFPVGRESSSGRSQMNIRGLDEEAIASFPTFFYSTVKELKIGKGSLECAICLNKFADDENLRLLHKCSHVFHSDCIDAWLTSHSTCPLCRAILVPQPDGWDSSFFPPVHSDYESGMGEADDRSSPNESVNRTEIHISENSIPNQTNQNSSSILRSPFRSCTPGWRLNRIFHRSHSTGHSLLPPRGNYERFTLRLPEDVRCELLKTTASLNQGRRCVSFRRIQSSRQGYRTASELEKNLIFPSNRMEWIDWSEWRRLFEHKGSGSELLSLRVNEDAA